MKMTTNDMNKHISEQEKKSLQHENNADCISESNNTYPVFAAIDLWRLQKKHKTLGTSTRWQPL